MAEPPPRFADVVARHRAEILRYLVRLLGDVEDARDACQETMLRAHVAFPRLRPDSNPRAPGSPAPPPIPPKPPGGAAPAGPAAPRTSSWTGFRRRLSRRPSSAR